MYIFLSVFVHILESKVKGGPDFRKSGFGAFKCRSDVGVVCVIFLEHLAKGVEMR